MFLWIILTLFDRISFSHLIVADRTGLFDIFNFKSRIILNNRQKNISRSFCFQTVYVAHVKMLDRYGERLILKYKPHACLIFKCFSRRNFDPRGIYTSTEYKKVCVRYRIFHRNGQILHHISLPHRYSYSLGRNRIKHTKSKQQQQFG